MARLNAAEKRLLRHPPTETTWECNRVRIRHTDGMDGGVVKVRCEMVNPGSAPHCSLCRAPKPRKPKLLWPRYVAACKKAGINPGDRWRDPADAVELAAAYRQRERAADKRRKGQTK